MEGSQHAQSFGGNEYLDIGKGIAQRSGHSLLAFRGMTNHLHERRHEDKQARKNAQRIKVRMVEFELRLDVDNQT
ncbi:hypothetical protein GW17_00041098 [Ensete ventricosum]|nr:hypothetical protein GW17_00041098 [Ensete ventricosum]